MTLEEAKTLLWGTFGEEALEYSEKRLGDLDDMYLKNIFCNQKHISDEYRKAIRLILKDRSGAWLEIEEQRPSIRRREAIEATKAKTKV